MEANYITGNKLTVKQEKFYRGSFAGLTQRKAYTESSDEVDWTLINEVSRGSSNGTFNFDNKGAFDMVVVKYLGVSADQIEISGLSKLVEVTNVSATLPDADLKLIEKMMSNSVTGPVVDI